MDGSRRPSPPSQVQRVVVQQELFQRHDQDAVPSTHEPPSEPGRKRNRKVLDRWLAREREARRRLLERMASLLSREAEPVAPGPQADPDDVPEELASLLESAFVVVPMLMRGDELIA